MRRRAARSLLVRWSTRVYEWALYAYPSSFHHAFGDSMTQVFRDLVRDALAHVGVRGVAGLWIRTAWDLAVSVLTAYARERREAMRRTVLIATAAYVGLSIFTAGYGAVRYGEFYATPAFNEGRAPGAGEDVLVAAYESALAGELGRYRTFAFGTGLALSLLLGVASGLFAVWQRSVVRGGGAFAVGAAAAMVTLSLIPTIWFPLDSYPVAALWVMGGGLPLAAAIWLAVTAIGLPARRRLQPVSA